MQPATTRRRQAPLFLYSAISRIASIDSCLALSMKAHVLTMSTSASEASCVRLPPACCASPSITSESTRFFGQPSEIIPIFIWCLGRRRLKPALYLLPTTYHLPPRDTTDTTFSDTESSRAHARARKSTTRIARFPYRNHREAPSRTDAGPDTIRMLPAADCAHGCAAGAVRDRLHAARRRRSPRILQARARPRRAPCSAAAGRSSCRTLSPQSDSASRTPDDRSALTTQSRRRRPGLSRTRTAVLSLSTTAPPRRMSFAETAS